MPRDPIMDVLPLLKVADDDEGDGSRVADDGESLILRPFVGSLVIAYVVEEGDKTRELRHKDLFASGADAKGAREALQQGLHDRALANLARYVEKTGIKLKTHGSLMTVQFDGDWEATLLLYPKLWKHLCDEMGDELVVAVPARDVLAVAPLDSDEGVAELGRVVDRVWPRDHHRLSEELLCLVGGEWRVVPSSPS